MPVPLSVSSSLGEAGGEGYSLVPTNPFHKASPREPWTQEASLLTAKTARGEKDSLPSWPSYGHTGMSVSMAARGRRDGRWTPFCWAFCCGCQHCGWDLEGTPLLLGLDQALPLSPHAGMQASLTQAGLCRTHGKDIKGTQGQIILHLPAVGFGTFLRSIWH